eukprot:TRINITY_DN35756_c0_g1_i1.p1 TRINITY_DN35756_c0_g1~~TRINITY_DN35756_c0_g1_i1.p1  ORF type:complete len:323 (+),score=110.66 TRINITY_DN35756_c0_g1_i1:74-970(+)
MEHAAAGACAASFAELCTMPVDTTKVRLQLRKEGFGRMLPTFRNIVVNEGPRALFRGARAAVARQGTYSALCFYGFNGMGIPRDTYFQKLVVGGTVGAFSVACVNPIDVVKVRMQSGGYSYAGVSSGIRAIYAAEGLGGMLAGVSPAMQRAFVVNAAELGTYAQAKEFLMESYPSLPCAAHHLSASLAAGAASAIASNPLDVAKTRLMAAPIGQRGSLFGVVVSTVRNEGPAALYKGLFPNWLRKGPHCAIQFVLYEQLVCAFKTLKEGEGAAEQVQMLQTQLRALLPSPQVAPAASA